MKLSRLIRCHPATARAVRLENCLDNASFLRHYLLTGHGLALVKRLIAGLQEGPVSAWSLTGPYGMGKSACINFLLALCGPAEQPACRVATQMLKARDETLLLQLEAARQAHQVARQGFLRIPVTAALQPLNHTLARGLEQALRLNTAFSLPRALNLRLKQLLKNSVIDGQSLVELYDEAARRLRTPLLIVLDEFGKNLEFMARNPAEGDIFSLQALAEAPNTFLWVCLHQAFEDYSAGFSDRQLQEWGKIQGRFEDITFVEPHLQMIELIGRTLQPQSTEGKTHYAQKWAQAFARRMQASPLPELKALDIQQLQRFYPLHPLAVLVLPTLCTRFAQNERTLFAFLSGAEPHALAAFLSRTPVVSPSGMLNTLGLDELYDYFLTATTGIFLNRPDASRWIEISSIIQGAVNLPESERSLLKHIGLLNLIAGPQHFRASEQFLQFALFRPGQQSLETQALSQSLQHLCEQGLLHYREYADEYRLWEGSDFDLARATELQKERLMDAPLTALLERTAPQALLPAARHSYQTGTLRCFECRWTSMPQLEQVLRQPVAEETDTGRNWPFTDPLQRCPPAPLCQHSGPGSWR